MQSAKNRCYVIKSDQDEKSLGFEIYDPTKEKDLANLEKKVSDELSKESARKIKFTFLKDLILQNKKPGEDSPFLIYKHSDEKLGFGLIANRNFRFGEIVCDYQGEFLDSKNKDDSTYSFNIQQTTQTKSGKEIKTDLLSAKQMGSAGRFANHSYCPNVEFYFPSKTGNQKIYRYKAIKNIKKGELILFDYAPQYWADNKIEPEYIHPYRNHQSRREFLDERHEAYNFAELQPLTKTIIDDLKLPSGKATHLLLPKVKTKFNNLPVLLVQVDDKENSVTVFEQQPYLTPLMLAALNKDITQFTYLINIRKDDLFAETKEHISALSILSQKCDTYDAFNQFFKVFWFAILKTFLKKYDAFETMQDNLKQYTQFWKSFLKKHIKEEYFNQIFSTYLLSETTNKDLEKLHENEKLEKIKKPKQTKKRKKSQSIKYKKKIKANQKTQDKSHVEKENPEVLCTDGEIIPAIESSSEVLKLQEKTFSKEDTKLIAPEKISMPPVSINLDSVKNTLYINSLVSMPPAPPIVSFESKLQPVVNLSKNSIPSKINNEKKLSHNTKSHSKNKRRARPFMTSLTRQNKRRALQKKQRLDTDPNISYLKEWFHKDNGLRKEKYDSILLNELSSKHSRSTQPRVFIRKSKNFKPTDELDAYFFTSKINRFKIIFNANTIQACFEKSAIALTDENLKEYFRKLEPRLAREILAILMILSEDRYLFREELLQECTQIVMERRQLQLQEKQQLRTKSKPKNSAQKPPKKKRQKETKLEAPPTAPQYSSIPLTNLELQLATSIVAALDASNPLLENPAPKIPEIKKFYKTNEDIIFLKEWFSAENNKRKKEYNSLLHLYSNNSHNKSTHKKEDMTQLKDSFYSAKIAVLKKLFNDPTSLKKSFNKGTIHEEALERFIRGHKYKRRNILVILLIINKERKILNDASLKLCMDDLTSGTLKVKVTPEIPSLTESTSISTSETDLYPPAAEPSKDCKNEIYSLLLAAKLRTLENPVSTDNINCLEIWLDMKREAFEQKFREFSKPIKFSKWQLTYVASDLCKLFPDSPNLAHALYMGEINFDALDNIKKEYKKGNPTYCIVYTIITIAYPHLSSQAFAAEYAPGTLPKKAKKYALLENKPAKIKYTHNLNIETIHTLLNQNFPRIILEEERQLKDLCLNVARYDLFNIMFGSLSFIPMDWENEAAPKVYELIKLLWPDATTIARAKNSSEITIENLKNILATDTHYDYYKQIILTILFQSNVFKNPQYTAAIDEAIHSAYPSYQRSLIPNFEEKPFLSELRAFSLFSASTPKEITPSSSVTASNDMTK